MTLPPLAKIRGAALGSELKESRGQAQFEVMQGTNDRCRKDIVWRMLYIWSLWYVAFKYGDLFYFWSQGMIKNIQIESFFNYVYY